MGKINTTFIANSVLNKSYNQLWKEYDKDKNGFIDFKEFQLLARDSVSTIPNSLIDKYSGDIFNNIAGGKNITREQMSAFVKRQFGLEINPDSNIGAQINRYNLKQQFGANSQGNNLYKEVKGIGSGKADEILTTLIDTSNVVATVKDFNKLSPEESIMTYLDNEWGLTADEMDNIPVNIRKLAGSLGLENTNQYKNLKKALNMENSFTGDYGSDKAKALDKAIKEMIPLIENLLK